MTKNSLRFPLLAIACFGFGSVSRVEAACTDGSPRVSTDKEDYPPFAIVPISGSGFGCGQTLSVLVTAPDGTIRSGNGAGAAGPDLVTTDGNGAFVLGYSLYGTPPGGGIYAGQSGAYTVKITDSSGVVLGGATFTDGSGFHNCALTASGGVKCWGTSVYGELGAGAFTDSATPVDVSGLTRSSFC